MTDINNVIVEYIKSRGVTTPQDFKKRSLDLIDIISTILLQNKILQDEVKND